MCAKTHLSVCHDSSICVPWLIYICHIPMPHPYVCHDSSMCMPRLIYMCDMTNVYVCRDSFVCTAHGHDTRTIVYWLYDLFNLIFSRDVTWYIHMTHFYIFTWLILYIHTTRSVSHTFKQLILYIHMTRSVSHTFIWLILYIHMTRSVSHIFTRLILYIHMTRSMSHTFTWLILYIHMTRSVSHIFTRLILYIHMTRSVSHTFIWLILYIHRTYSAIPSLDSLQWNDISVKWYELSHMTQFSWLIPMCAMTYLCVCHDSVIRVPWRIHVCMIQHILMAWLWLVRSIKLQFSLSKEPYKRDIILQKRPIIFSTLLTVATA